MNIKKKWFISLLALAVICIFFKGPLFRACVTYKSIGLRPNYTAKDKKLVDYIDSFSVDADIHNVIKQGLVATSELLHFTVSNNPSDPNKLINAKAAHCVGYAAFFAAACNRMLKKNGLSKTWTAKPQVGYLYVFGVNINNYMKTPFTKDHDFVTIENKVTGEILAVDPSIHDYLFIDFINYQY
ncbi:hypothetical protein [Arcticibacterium luteifluviistationis]|uniref:Transglutaminase-like domain-containing protein n=1 Tax=Arcticibacterium luteifluviistationis TaxID=1784714 RepID=A0A2Z4GBE2_9BACT|nr:hypothetical protein [Arcticibacterium luteifluviistationis]AWV98253.1 hypothetical protein DJ013_08760 [Arcticibacterium luteifluviistationis]